MTSTRALPTTEMDFQYRVGHLPGGMNVGDYSFNQDFARLNSRLVLQPGEGLVVPKETARGRSTGGPGNTFTSTTGQPPSTCSTANRICKASAFFPFRFRRQRNKPTLWAISGGIGGRGIIPFRDNDTFGIGYYYNSVQQLGSLGILGLEDSAQGFECFYNIALTPACRVTLDLQVVNAPLASLDTATVLGLRASLEF